MLWGFPPHEELGYCFQDIAADAENKVIILTGTGNSFIDRDDLGAGGDGGDVVAHSTEVWAGHLIPDAKRMIMGLLEIQAPMIAAVKAWSARSCAAG